MMAVAKGVIEKDSKRERIKAFYSWGFNTEEQQKAQSWIFFPLVLWILKVFKENAFTLVETFYSFFHFTYKGHRQMQIIKKALMLNGNFMLPSIKIPGGSKAHCE